MSGSFTVTIAFRPLPSGLMVKRSTTCILSVCGVRNESIWLLSEIPIVSTSYTPIATGGVGVNPLNSFQLKPVGINIDITPIRVTLEGDILIDLTVESSSRGGDVNIAGTNYPSFGSRKVQAHLRLRDGESNLLAGLLREDERAVGPDRLEGAHVGRPRVRGVQRKIGGEVELGRQGHRRALHEGRRQAAGLELEDAPLEQPPPPGRAAGVGR